MSYEKKPDRRRVSLLPPSLDDWVPGDHPARFIDAFVESSDIPGLGFEVGHAPTGRPRYSAQLLLSVHIYCYFDRIRSLRRMERACLENVALMWLTGNEHPDHNTLWRFFRDNKKAIRKVLRQSVKVAADADLIGMVLHAVDRCRVDPGGYPTTTRDSLPGGGQPYPDGTRPAGSVWKVSDYLCPLPRACLGAPIGFGL